MKVIKKATPTAPKLLLYGMSGCIDGEAEITFKSSLFENPICAKKIKLRNLHKRVNGDMYPGWRGEHAGEEIFVRSMDESTEQFTWSKVEEVYFSGVKPVFEIATSTRKTIATGTHLFWTKNGWRQLSQLSIGDAVAVCPPRMQRGKGKSQVKSKEICVKYHPLAPHKVVNGCEYCRMSEHRFIYEAFLNGMSPSEYRDLLNGYDGRDIKVIPSGMEVHHINGDHHDNRPENMELLSKRDHALVGLETSVANLRKAPQAVYEEIVSITPIGERATYDIRCADPHHSFLADNFVVHNTGKSTLASKLKKPIFIDLEGGLNYMDVDRTPTLTKFEEVYVVLAELFNAAKSGKREYDTIVIDSADWLVRKIVEKAAGIDKTKLDETLNRSNGGYGNGKQVLENHIRTQLLPMLQLLNGQGYGICLVAHADRKTMMNADGTDSEQISPKIDVNTMAVFVEWADSVFYLKKDIDGSRVLLLESDGVALAKNRVGLSGEVNINEIDINELLMPQAKENK